MRIIAIQEPEIKALFDKLDLRNIQLKTSFDPEVANDIHRKFHYELVKFFQEAGSNYPNG